MKEVLSRVKQKIKVHGLNFQQAAAEIGVTSASLQRHLSGEYVRSDSLAKYRLWVDGHDEAKSQKNYGKIEISHDSAISVSEDLIPPKSICIPVKPYRVIDLFCGCGGMSLGFDSLKNGSFFKTVLAMDIEEPMVRVYNDNHPVHNHQRPIARLTDLTDFYNECEILAFYLEHLAMIEDDKELVEALKNIAGTDLYKFVADIQSLDQAFLSILQEIRDTEEYGKEHSKMGSTVLNQTSVIGFHKQLGLPTSGKGGPKLQTLIWSSNSVSVREDYDSLESSISWMKIDQKFFNLWDAEQGKLEERTNGNGAGQLSSASKKIDDFIEFIESKPLQEIKKLWAGWQTARESLRRKLFGNKQVEKQLRKLYENDREVEVLLGGPPCQGFSRIGRGKIRSLREQSVHVHEDKDTADSRNKLMHQYVLFVAALAPKIFLFENVRHFQSKVQTPEGTFDATDVLSEAIRNVSHQGTGYTVSSRIIYASRHLIPQTRERFFMSGIREDYSVQENDISIAEWSLTLDGFDQIKLETALEGLPSPLPPESGNTAKKVQVESSTPGSATSDPVSRYKKWISSEGNVLFTDGHVARLPRNDDRSFFALMGPGKRWMDYRSDKSPSIEAMKEIVVKLSDAAKCSPELLEQIGIDKKQLKVVSSMLDGSLSLRLLLESIPLQPGEIQHHLLTPNYLKKRDGKHGDWLARMDPSKPAKTMVSHMAKDTYAYVHPYYPRTISVREAARIQSFPDSYKLGCLGLVDGFRVIGNAVPPLLSLQFAQKAIQVLQLSSKKRVKKQRPCTATKN